MKTNLVLKMKERFHFLSLFLVYNFLISNFLSKLLILISYVRFVQIFGISINSDPIDNSASLPWVRIAS